MEESEIWEISDQMSLAVAPLIGMWKQLAEELPEEVAEDAFAFILHGMSHEQEKELERMRYHTARAYADRTDG